MTRKDALAELIAKVEAGQNLSGNTEFWACAETAFSRKAQNVGDMAKSYHGSLDAAKALHEAVLPGWFAGVSENIHGHGWYGWVQTNERHMEARSDQPARAWLLAILRALQSMEPDT